MEPQPPQPTPPPTDPAKDRLLIAMFFLRKLPAKDFISQMRILHRIDDYTGKDDLSWEWILKIPDYAMQYGYY